MQLCAAYLQSKSGGGGGVHDAGNAIGNGTFSWAGAAANISRSGSMWQNLLDAGEPQWTSMPTRALAVPSNKTMSLLHYPAGLVDKLLASLLRGQGIPAKQRAAFIDCMRDALQSSSSLGTTAIALQTLQGFIDGNGWGSLGNSLSDACSSSVQYVPCCRAAGS